MKGWEKFVPLKQDSRKIQERDWFLAIKGEEADGHHFIDEAIKRGAKGIICEKGRVKRRRDAEWLEVENTEGWLFDLARRKLEYMRPQIIGVTGSVGKTGTKEAVTSVLGERHKVLKSPQNINTHRGLSLFILNQLSPEHQIFVAEMAVDRTNEMREITQTISPDIAVITWISQTHLEKFGTLENIKKTKAQILEALPQDGLAILNRDSPHVVEISKKAPGKIIWYGTKKRLRGLRASDISFTFSGTYFLLRYKGKVQKMHISLLGRPAIYAVLPAVALGMEMGMNFRDIKKGLSQLRPMEGRLNIRRGKKGVWILDDTYNASDVSSLAALEVLDQLPGKRKVACFGDMLELGAHEEEAHRIVGERAGKVVDILIAVGKKGRMIGEALRQAPEVYFAKDTKEGREILKELDLGKDDIILFKGSRGAHMERMING